jgi:5-methylcytosine-specific restriction endonuclease McrBC regulatory subunit McrC
MYELFERWVEHLVRLWARGFGAQVRSGRTHETVMPIRWQHSGARSLSSLIPDFIVKHSGHTWIIDSKYKGHFEELDDHRWGELAEELQSEHRHDIHQILAYAAATDARQITTVLVYGLAGLVA